VAETEEPGPGARRRRDQREGHEDGRRPRHPPLPLLAESIESSSLERQYSQECKRFRFPLVSDAPAYSNDSPVNRCLQATRGEHIRIQNRILNFEQTSSSFRAPPLLVSRNGRSQITENISVPCDITLSDSSQSAPSSTGATATHQTSSFFF
jgi:hypothetical protein